MLTLGIDVSLWQPWGLTDWQTARDAGYKFVFIKAGEWARMDPRFADHWANAKTVGLPRGAYIFYRFSVDPIVQAKQLIGAVKRENELPLVVDVEEEGTFAPGLYDEKVHICLREIQELSGQRVMVYTSATCWKRLVGPVDWADDFMLWVAQYPNRPPVEPFKPLIPDGWTHWHYWQFSGSGTIPGIRGNVDLNFINGELPCTN